MDDFYLLSPSHLVVTETTNDVFDTSLYKSVVPQAAPSLHFQTTARTILHQTQSLCI